VNQEHRDKLDALVAALLEHETLDAKQVTTILGPHSEMDIEAGVTPQQPVTIEAEAATEAVRSEDDGVSPPLVSVTSADGTS
jgi:hypothetical protein